MLEKRGIRMKEVTKQAEETQISHKTLRLMIGTLCSVIGTLLALYVGGWLMLCKPIQGWFLHTLQEILQLESSHWRYSSVCCL